MLPASHSHQEQNNHTEAVTTGSRWQIPQLGGWVTTDSDSVGSFSFCARVTPTPLTNRLEGSVVLLIHTYCMKVPHKCLEPVSPINPMLPSQSSVWNLFAPLEPSHKEHTIWVWVLVDLLSLGASVTPSTKRESIPVSLTLICWKVPPDTINVALKLPGSEPPSGSSWFKT